MINITRLWCGAEQPADHIRYGLGHGSHAPHSSTAACTPTSSRTRKPIVVWNITRTCNLRCVHCYADSHAQQYPGELDLAQCHAVIDDLADYQVNALLLSGGEPLLHPHLPELLEHATNRGLKVTISTNGTRITPEYAALFKRLGVAYVGISLDGIGAVHDSFRGVQGAFDGAIRGFRRCEEVGQKTGLRLTLTRNNVQSMEQILDFIERERIQRVCFYHLVPTGRGVDVAALKPAEARTALDMLIARAQAWHDSGNTRELLTVTQPADGIYILLRQLREGNPLAAKTLQLLSWNGGGANSSGRGIANIDTQGNIHPDQFWQSVTLGNVKTQKFSDVWEASLEPSAAELQKLRGSDDPQERQKLISGPCSTCRHFALCGGGFRTRAAFANGHWYGSDPACYLTDEERQMEIPR
ncbi:MAG: radical SAM protein [Akkermansia sp.]|nr:radical SAM protein [Akkermansia sp.]